MKHPYKTDVVPPAAAKEPVPDYTARARASHRKETPPEGCVTLEQFAEMFHQKLDDCYAELSNSCK